jgi:hypothetical protein
MNGLPISDDERSTYMYQLDVSNVIVAVIAALLMAGTAGVHGPRCIGVTGLNLNGIASETIRAVPDDTPVHLPNDATTSRPILVYLTAALIGLAHGPLHA